METGSSPAWDCQDCGACCATYRVSFYWAEADDAPGGTVPVGLTQPVSPTLRCMVGTATKPVRCVALRELPEVGEGCVGCGIYEQRSRPCREFPFASYGCHDTREKFGLPALSEAEIEPWLEAA